MCRRSPMTRSQTDHPTEAEFAAFVLDGCTEAQVKALEEHLEGCDECTNRLTDSYQAQLDFQHTQWSARRESFLSRPREVLREKHEVAQRLAAYLSGVRHPLCDAEVERAAQARAAKKRKRQKHSRAAKE